MNETTIRILTICAAVLFLVATPVLVPIHYICKVFGRRGIYSLDGGVFVITLSPETFRKGSS